MFFDSHTHLSDEILINNLHKIVSDYKNNGIIGSVEVGYDVKSSKKALEIANTYSNIYCAVGIHPEASSLVVEEDFLTIEQLAKEKKVVAIGEIGLDYHYDYDKSLQKSVFIRQIELAHALSLPIVIHLREAYLDMQDILFGHKHLITSGLLLHCYSGSAEMVKIFEPIDPYFAFGGVITFNNFKKSDVLRSIKKDRLLLETDCPYMTPVPLRGKPNNPNYIPFIAKKMAEELSMTENEIGELTTQNAYRFFKINS